MAASRSGFACMTDSQPLAQRLLPRPAPNKGREHSNEPLGLITALMTYAQLLPHRLLPLLVPNKGLPSVAPKKGFSSVAGEGAQR